MKRTVLPSVLLATSVLCFAGLSAFGQETEERQLSREGIQGQRPEMERFQEEPLQRRLKEMSVRGIRSSAVEEIKRILEEKMSRTPAQQKLESHLHHAGQLARGALHAETMPSLANANAALEFNELGTVHVDIQGTVNAALLAEIVALGGKVESSFPKYRAIRAWMPLLNVETLANRSDVTFIRPADQAFHNSGPTIGPVAGLGRLPLAQRAENVRRQLEAALPTLRSDRATRGAGLKSGPVTTAIVDTSGVVSEGADLVQALGIIGNGARVGVLSDGVMSLSLLQGAGLLPAVTVLSGQAGPPMGDEGTAMLETVHDFAPGAQLFFATAFTGAAQFATNIQNLAAAGCNIIVDDVTYGNEGAFQDGIVAQAVNTVTASGVLYFSSAANSGNLDSGTSGTWEGDFNGTGGAIPVINTAEGKPVTVHVFSGTQNFDSITKAASKPTTLMWSDPLGGSCNDYDLFVLDSGLTTVKDSSTNRQTCTQDAFEQTANPPAVGDAIVIVQFSGAPRALRLYTNRGQLSIGTAGATFGHNAAGSALTVAATPSQTSIFTSGNQSPETYSSDGPRKIFYNPNATPITPNNFLFATNGGTTLSKVDFTAADCGQTAVPTPGFNPFCGTSQAAPVAAAIAALVMSANPSLTPSAIKTAMSSTAIPTKAGFGPPTVGAGIVMANLSVNAVAVPFVTFFPSSAFFGTEPVGTSSAPALATLINTGAAALTMSGIATSGGNGADFGGTTNCPLSPASLAPGGSCTVNLTFKPTGVGPRKSSLIVNSNAGSNTPAFLLTGVGSAGGVSPTSLTFGSQAVGTTSAAQVVTFANKSSQTINLWQIAILGNGTDFPATTTCGSTLAAGASCTVSVTFKPTATGVRAGSLLFSNDGGGSPQSVTLTGTGS